MIKNILSILAGFILLTFYMLIIGCTKKEDQTVRVTSISLNYSQLELVEGTSQSLIVTISPSDARNYTLIWSSSNESVASVSNGIVTAISSGISIITVKTDDGENVATCEVTVNSSFIPVSLIMLDKTEVTMNIGEELTITETVMPENASNKNVSWRSSDTSVATVSEGKVVALKGGEATIFVRTENGDKEASCKVIIIKDLSIEGTANCYIVNESGTYRFPIVKGNSPEKIISAKSATLLWETYGTSTTPPKNSLIKEVYCEDNHVIFKTNEKFVKGNAVIAVSDSEGKIVWSWHIWLTEYPSEQGYMRNAGVMMDRNLGATSAEPGKVASLGLRYQWGRKDPFLGSSSISYFVEAKSTISWPKSINSDKSTGTIEFTISNPTTFINRYDEDENHYDWHYPSDINSDNIRWTSSEVSKSIYDPCPVGWRVSDGGKNGVWAKVVGRSYGFDIGESFYDSENNGMNFSGKFGNYDVIWYPFTGFGHNRAYYDPSYPKAEYWSASSNNTLGYCLFFDHRGNFNAAEVEHKSYDLPVRCVKE